MSRPRAPAAVLLAALALLISGCGNDRQTPADVSTVEPPTAAQAVDEADEGVAFEAPGGWQRTDGDPPLVSTLQTGRAVVGIWRYPRSEPLPATRKQLGAARDALLAAARARDAGFKEIRSAVTRVAGHPAVQIRGRETIEGRARTVRSTHVYAEGAEVVVDAIAPGDEFRRVDAQIFRPLLRSLKVSKPAAP
jgi:hypothetical protein